MNLGVHLRVTCRHCGALFASRSMRAIATQPEGHEEDCHTLHGQPARARKLVKLMDTIEHGPSRCTVEACPGRFGVAAARAHGELRRANRAVAAAAGNVLAPPLADVAFAAAAGESVWTRHEDGACRCATCVYRAEHEAKIAARLAHKKAGAR